jgi:hypothetical protein
MASVSKVIHTDTQLHAGQFGKTAYTAWIPSTSWSAPTMPRLGRRCPHSCPMRHWSGHDAGRGEEAASDAKGLDDRLTALARSHALLSQPGKTTATIKEILSQELSAQGGIEGVNLSQHGPELSSLFQTQTSGGV